MKWVKRLLGFVLVVGVLAGGTSWFWWATAQSPEFYRVAESQIASPVERKQVAQQFAEQSQQLVEEIKSAPQWSQEFTDAQINAWLIEEFPGEFAEWVPPEVSQPRVKLQEDGIRIGFKVDEPGQWKGIVSVSADVRVTEPNELAIVLKSVHVGLVSVPLQTVIDQLNERARENDIEIEWHRRGDQHEAIVRLKHEGPESPQLEQIEFLKGSLRISGTSPPKSGALQFSPRF
jgi:hypothetical protein